MKKILVLGAGQSSPYLIQYLLDRAEKYNWFVTVADRDGNLAARRIGDHHRANALKMDTSDTLGLAAEIKNATLVVNFLPPTLQPLIGWECIQHGRSMVSVSYRNADLRALDGDARRKGVLLLPEMGLDPGIDIMTAAEIVDRVRHQGGIIESFESYGGGLPAVSCASNPLRYVITWNPRNVVMAAEEGAQYMQQGKIKIVPWHHVFDRSWPVEIPGVGAMEGYPNRDSLSYRDVFGLVHVTTMIRGTLRWPGWSETWGQIVKLGLPNEHLRIPDLENRCFREIVEMFLPRSLSGSTIQQRVANFLGISPTGEIMKKLEWLGLFSEEPLGANGQTSAEALIRLLKRKLALPEGGCDMVVLHHVMDVRYPGDGDRRELITATFSHTGESGGMTAMSRSVGMPAAIAVKKMLLGEFPLTGCHIPTHPAIYEPVLEELKAGGLSFQEHTTPLPADPG